MPRFAAKLRLVSEQHGVGYLAPLRGGTAGGEKQYDAEVTRNSVYEIKKDKFVLIVFFLIFIVAGNLLKRN